MPPRTILRMLASVASLPTRGGQIAASACPKPIGDRDGCARGEPADAIIRRVLAGVSKTVSVAAKTPQTEDAMAESELFERGLQRRREVLGDEYVDANLRDSDEFMMAFQRAVTEVAWGWAWCRPGLDAKARSMISLAMLTALGRFDELGIYVKGALRSGVTVGEIQEVLIQAIAYCGTPAGRQAFLAVHQALSAEGAFG
jgi:4-carboxymuconolactone decarboxylase